MSESAPSTEAADAMATSGAPADLPRTRPPEEAPWLRGLPKDKRNNLKTTFANLCAVLRNDTDFGRFSFNERSGVPVFTARPGAAVGGFERPIEDGLMLQLREQIELRWGITASAQLFSDALMCVARERSFDPVRDELHALAWDGTPRLDTVSSRILGNDGRIEALMVRKWFIAAVARALDPGCKADTMLVLQGSKQGRFKSTFFATLAGEHFCDSVQDFEKDGLLAAHRAWIIELGELDGITRKSAVERIKNVLSRRADDLRRPYARAVETFKRSFVFCGTVNSSEFLHDETGNRRFWTVEVPGAIDIAALAAEREQLFAEAVDAYRGREPWWLSTDEAEQAEELSQRFAVGDAWDERIARWTRGASGEITTRRVLVEALGFDDARIDRAAQTRIGAAMRRLGFERVDVGDKRRGDRRRLYVRHDERVRVDVASDGHESPNPDDDSAHVGDVGDSRSRTQQAVPSTSPTTTTYINGTGTEGDREGGTTLETRSESLGCFSGEVGTATLAAEKPARASNPTSLNQPRMVVEVLGASPAGYSDDLNDLHEPDELN